MSDALGFMIGDVSRLLRRSFDERARGIGVTRPQWRMLSTLSRHEGSSQGALAELMEVEPITLCRMVDRLEDSGLVERRANPADRRAWQLYITPRGQALMDELRPLALSLFDDALHGLGEREQQALFAALDQVRANLIRRPEQLSHG
jgi:DNA-binding MarR family transcriptional regulator